MSEIKESTNVSECFFLTERNQAVIKLIDIRQFSLLIDLE